MAETLPARDQDSKRTVVVVIISILLAANALLLWQFFEKKKHLEEVTKTLEVTTSDKDQLSAELLRIKAEYDKLNEENSALHNQLTERDEAIRQKMEQIQRLINSGDAEKLKQARAELEVLKRMNENYLAEMESLKTVNIQLNEKNTQLVTNLNTEQTKVATLQQENSVLSNKVAVGSVLKASNLILKAVRIKNSGKELETNRASRTDKLKISCIINENKVIDAGMQNIYIRVLSPDGAVMSTSQETFDYNGQATLYSAKESVDYQNRDTEFSIYWSKGTAYSKGRYTVELYCNGNQIGSSNLDLK